MSNQRMIVSSRNLMLVLQGAAEDKPVLFHAIHHIDKPHGFLYVNGTNVGEACHTPERPWRMDFDVPYPKARRLMEVLSTLEVQPITLEWDGDHFILHHVAV